MSIATVVTRGFGTFGSVNKLPTLGYGADGSAALVYGPLSFCPEVTIVDPGVFPLMPTPWTQSDAANAREIDVELI